MSRHIIACLILAVVNFVLASFRSAKYSSGGWPHGVGGFYHKIGPPQRVANLLFVLDNFLKKKKMLCKNYFLKFLFRFVNYSYPPPVTVNSETKRIKKKTQKT